MIVDTPGQVELFAFREASSYMIDVLGREQAAIIYLFDPMLSKSPSGFVSQMLLSSIVEFRLGLPTKNFLSKSDLLSKDELEQILENRICNQPITSNAAILSSSWLDPAIV